MSNPYERPTDELRQVRHARPDYDIMSALMGKEVVWYTVQRKWLVAEAGWTDPSLAPLTEEWRDLPIVTEEQVRAERGETPSTT